VIATGQTALAQAKPKYDVMPVPQIILDADRKIDVKMAKEEKAAIQEAKTTKRGLEMLVANVLRNSPDVSLDDEKTKKNFDGWYTQYYFAILTHPEHLSKWTETRRKFLKILTPSNVPPKVHEHLVDDLAIPTMLTIAKGNYHPVARYNATLFIGSLNDHEAVLIGEKKQLPVPSMLALARLIGEYADANQIDAVRVAALVGILRHVKIDSYLPSENRRLAGNNAETRIVDLATNLISQKDAPEGRSQGGHDWMRRQAIEIAGFLGSVGQNGKVVSALDALVADETTPVSLRCSAAEALGRLNYPANTNMNVADTAKKFGAVAVYACHKELMRVEDQQKLEEEEKGTAGGASAFGGQSFGGALGGTSSGAYGAAFGGKAAAGPLAYRIAMTRRRVKYQTLLVKTGLVGVKQDAKRPRPRFGSADESADAAAEETKKKERGILALAKSPEDQEYVKKVVDGIDAIVAVTDNSKVEDLTSLVTDIRNKVNELEQSCEIVVDMGDSEGDVVDIEDLLANPAEPMDIEAGMELPVGPPSEPPTGPSGKTPADPGVKPPTKPAVTAPAKQAADSPAKPAVTAPAKPPAPVKPPAKAPTNPAGAKNPANKP